MPYSVLFIVQSTIAWNTLSSIHNGQKFKMKPPSIF